MGMRSSRNRARIWLPARPPKMPYSCCKQTRSTLLMFKKVGGAAIGIDVLLRQFEAHAGRIGVAALDVVDGQRDARRVGVFGGDRLA